MKKNNKKTSRWDSKTQNMDYFINQLKTPYQSSIAFFDFLEELNLINSESSIVDACCGSGANAFYAFNRFSLKKIIGFDYQEEFLSLAKEYQKNLTKYNEVCFIQANIYEIDDFLDDLRKNKITFNDGVIFLQTMSWLTNWRESLKQLSKLNTNWIAISSLFYEGLIEAEITINTYPDTNSEPISFPYNVYSMPIVEEYLKVLGFKNFYWKKFELKTPLKKPNNINKMGSYTIEDKNGKLITISGPIMLPWSFLVAKR